MIRRGSLRFNDARLALTGVIAGLAIE